MLILYLFALFSTIKLSVEISRIHNSFNPLIIKDFKKEINHANKIPILRLYCFNLFPAHNQRINLRSEMEDSSICGLTPLFDTNPSDVRGYE